MKTKNKIKLILNIMLSIILFPVSLCYLLVFFKDFKFYKVIFNKITKENTILKKGITQIYCIQYDFIYFIKDKSFKLTDGVYLHKCFYMFCPYYHYWYIKYLEWFQTEASSKELEYLNDEDLDIITKYNK